MKLKNFTFVDCQVYAKWQCASEQGIELLLVSGQIVSVETLTVPIQSGVVDCDVTRWIECADSDIPCAFVLRVFYNREVNGRIYGSEKVHVGSFFGATFYYIVGPGNHQRCSSCYCSWGCCFHIFNVLRLFHFTTDHR